MEKKLTENCLEANAHVQRNLAVKSEACISGITTQLTYIAKRPLGDIMLYEITFEI